MSLSAYMRLPGKIAKAPRPGGRLRISLPGGNRRLSSPAEIPLTAVDSVHTSAGSVVLHAESWGSTLLSPGLQGERSPGSSTLTLPRSPANRTTTPITNVQTIAQATQPECYMAGLRPMAQTHNEVRFFRIFESRQRSYMISGPDCRPTLEFCMFGFVHPFKVVDVISIVVLLCWKRARELIYILYRPGDREASRHVQLPEDSIQYNDVASSI